MKIKNETCELEIEANPLRKPQKANAYYGVRLLSGGWPDNNHLITICDNGNFDGACRHFGGTVISVGNDYKSVTVYVD